LGPPLRSTSGYYLTRPSGFQIAASKPATRILQLAPKAHQDNSLGCKAQDHLEKERALQARWKNCVTKYQKYFMLLSCRNPYLVC
jgi:hypothetical protein